MNLSTLVGMIIALIVFVTALLTSTSNVGVFFNTHALLIVVGGTASASFICFSLPKVFGLFNVFVKRMLGKNKRDFSLLIDEITRLSKAMHQDKNAYANAIKSVQDPFLKDGAEVLFWVEADVTPTQLRDLLDTRARTHFKRYMQEADIFRVISKFPPAFGLMGTTLGMISLLQSLGDPNTKSQIGPSMAIALVATLYGIALTNLLFIPIAENLSKQTQEDQVARQMVVEAIMLIQGELPTKYVQEKVKSFLLPSERLGTDAASAASAAARASGKAA